MTDGPTDDRLVRRLPEYMPKDPDSGNFRLFKSITHEIDDLHYDTSSVDRAATVQHADTIDQLEKLGRMVNLDHKSGDSKEKYRAKVLSEYQLNTSEGTVRDILNSVGVITDSDIQNLKYYPLPTTDSEASVGVPGQKLDASTLTESELAEIVDKLAPAGKRIYTRRRGDLYYITESEYKNNNYDSTKGYDTTKTNVTQDFTSSTLPSGWTINGDATYDSTNNRVKLDTANSNDSGNVVYDSGIGGIKRWSIEFDGYIDGSADAIMVNFYADGPGTDDSSSNGYKLEIDHYNDKIRLRDLYNATTVAKVNVSIPDTTATNSFRVSYFKGRVRVFMNDEQYMETTISNPDYTNDGLSFGAWSGGASGLHALKNFRFIGGDQKDPSGSSSGTYAGLIQ